MDKAKKGVYAATLTPFQQDGHVDMERLTAYCHWILEQGLTGVAPLGTTGEGNSVSLVDRLAAPQVLAKAGVPADRTIIGTGACALGDATAATLAAVEAGYKNVLVLPPFYYKSVSDEGIYDYYARLIDGVGDDGLRIYLYHFPQMSMTPISVPLVQRLKTEFGAVIAGLKDSSGDLQGSIAFAAAADDFDVYPSNEGSYVAGIEGGCAGVISATTNASVGAIKGLLSNDPGTVSQSLAIVAEIRALIAKFPLSAALKEIQAQRSGDDAWRAVAPPQTSLSEQDAAALMESLAAHQKSLEGVA